MLSAALFLYDSLIARLMTRRSIRWWIPKKCFFVSISRLRWWHRFSSLFLVCRSALRSPFPSRVFRIAFLFITIFWKVWKKKIYHNIWKQTLKLIKTWKSSQWVRKKIDRGRMALDLAMITAMRSFTFNFLYTRKKRSPRAKKKPFSQSRIRSEKWW